MRVPIVVPAAARRAAGVPEGIPLELVSAWWMDEGRRRGLWVAERGGTSGQTWPITGVVLDDAKAWIEAGS